MTLTNGSRPNILLIVLDTVRAQQLSCYGHTGSTTPRIDQIAEEGVRYHNAISPSPWTLPAHASLFTATFPSKHGAHELHKYLDLRLPTLAEFLTNRGYQTIGLSNNSWISNTFGLARGFDTFVKIWQIAQTESDVTNRAVSAHEDMQHLRAADVMERILDGNPMKNLINGIYARFLWRRYDKGARRINSEMRRWLTKKRSHTRPFFMFANYLEAHLKYRPPAPYDKMYLPPGCTVQSAGKVSQDAWSYISRTKEMSANDFQILTALYDGEVTYLDGRIGEIYDLLHDVGLLDDTVLIITSDHGENIGDHGLMDHQYCLYDTLLRVPLIIRYPRLFPAGEQVFGQVQLVDVFPTVMDILNTAGETFRQEMQGETLLPDRLDDRQRKFAVAEYLGPQPNIKLLRQRVPGADGRIQMYDRSLACIRVEDFKYIQASDGCDELFDIRIDPSEAVNLISSKEQVWRRMRRELAAWQEQTGPAYQAGELLSVDRATRSRLEALGYLG